MQNCKISHSRLCKYDPSMVFVTKLIRLTSSRPLLSMKYIFSINYFHVEGFVFESRSQHSLKQVVTIQLPHARQ